MQECVPAISGSQAEHRKDWAKAANVSVAELDRIEAEGPLAAHLILASTEGLLKSLCWRYVSRVILFALFQSLVLLSTIQSIQLRACFLAVSMSPLLVAAHIFKLASESCAFGR